MRGPGEAEPAYAFECFLHKVLSHVEDAVTANPDKYKPRHRERRDPVLRPRLYPTLLLLRRSPQRVPCEAVREAGVWPGARVESVDVTDTVFVGENGEPIEPGDISSGNEIVPIFRVSYFRNANKFGLNITMLKGWCMRARLGSAGSTTTPTLRSISLCKRILLLFGHWELSVPLDGGVEVEHLFVDLVYELRVLERTVEDAPCN
jgi:hypothetical protein